MTRIITHIILLVLNINDDNIENQRQVVYNLTDLNLDSIKKLDK